MTKRPGTGTPAPTPRDDRSKPPGWIDAGLRHRMRYEEGRISSQHDQLNTLYAAVLGALQRGSVHVAHQAFVRFADALEAHFALEDELYVPALHGLRPELGASLGRLADEHGALRERIEEIRALLGSAESATSSELLLVLADKLADHEDREEALIASINNPSPPE